MAFASLETFALRGHHLSTPVPLPRRGNKSHLANKDRLVEFPGRVWKAGISARLVSFI